ncbi:MAG TPA: pyrroline-5-carboxylate reductase [Nitrospira sp.]|jgi:pyrroline-5-carboxylate reductase|nr:pyrroline-5-carboxylate reductase [Nitrospira sp.]
MLSDRTIGFIGAGNMAEALIAGLLHASRLAAGRLLASDIDESRLAWLQHTYKIRMAQSNAAAAQEADILVLAVEPQILDEVLAEIAGSVRADTLVVSVAAGYPIGRVARVLSGVRGIVRSMPNTPSLVREGITALAYEDRLSARDVDAVRTLFESIGQVIRVEERWLDAVTGLSGSGPAYVYVMIEALADGGVKMGLPRETAQLLAAQTVLGAARLVLDSHQHPGVLKDRVASPGGTSIAGLHELERGGLRAALMSAVEAAAQRSQELGTVL